MEKKTRRRRRNGSLVDLKKALWAAIGYNCEVIENTDLSHELRQRASNALSQAALAYLRVTEVADIEQGLRRLEHAAERAGRNGHEFS
jgi:hypothetical protein